MTARSKLSLLFLLLLLFEVVSEKTQYKNTEVKWQKHNEIFLRLLFKAISLKL